jgi:hypothetical protein
MKVSAHSYLVCFEPFSYWNYFHGQSGSTGIEGMFAGKQAHLMR